MINFSVCAYCEHRSRGETMCDAFPDGIPETFYLGVRQHTESVEGDDGVVFNPRDDLNAVELDMLRAEIGIEVEGADMQESAEPLALLELAGEKTPFTGVAPNGHHYVEGKQVTKEEFATKTGKKETAQSKPTEAPAAPHLDKLDKATEKLGAEIEESPKAKGRAREVFDKVANKLTVAALEEFPKWALDTADLWMFEETLSQAGQQAGLPFAVLLTKAAAFGAAKAYLAVRKAMGKGKLESAPSEPDDVLKSLHETLKAIADAAGLRAPSLELLQHRMERAKDELGHDSEGNRGGSDRGGVADRGAEAGAAKVTGH